MIRKIKAIYTNEENPMESNRLSKKSPITDKYKQVALLLLALSTFPAWSCPFDEAGIEVTVQAHTAISAAVDSKNYKKASEEIINLKYLYEYFEESTNEPLYQPLLEASNAKDGKKVRQLLDHSLVLEIKELLLQVEENFNKYQTARLRIIKAKKHLKVLTSEKEPMDTLKKILKSIGNPGLMGMGKEKPDMEMFLNNRKKLLDII